MAVTVQITFDCADPHLVARFWAMALGYQKEDHTNFVDSLLAEGALQPKDVIDVDGGRGFADVSACRDPAGLGPGCSSSASRSPRSSRTASTSTFTSGTNGSRPRRRA